MWTTILRKGDPRRYGNAGGLTLLYLQAPRGTLCRAMVHTVNILKYVAAGAGPGSLKFELDGATYHARCDADPALADGLLVEGSSYPVALTIEAEGKVEYANPGQPALEVLQSSEAGDKVQAVGRTWDSMDHQVIKLDAQPTVGVKLNLPQTATDYRGGSWLSATGVLCADLPPEEHD